MVTKVLGLDPGKQRDSFALVAVEEEGGKYLVKNAQRFLGRDYLEVEKSIAELHKIARFSYIILELNNTGHHVLEVLRNQYHLPVLAVTTTADVKDEEKKRSHSIMDKNEMVRQMMHWFQDGTIIFPKNSNQELDELKRQLSIFSEIKTESGKVSYRAEGSEHDDLVMALMLCLHHLRHSKITIIKVPQRTNW